MRLRFWCVVLGASATLLGCVTQLEEPVMPFGLNDIRLGMPIDEIPNLRPDAQWGDSSGAYEEHFFELGGAHANYVLYYEGEWFGRFEGGVFYTERPSGQSCEDAAPTLVRDAVDLWGSDFRVSKSLDPTLERFEVTRLRWDYPGAVTLVSFGPDEDSCYFHIAVATKRFYEKWLGATELTVTEEDRQQVREWLGGA